MAIQDILQFFDTHHYFLITSHIEPDGDSIGSELALAMQIERLSKKAYIINPEPVPKKYRFLYNWETIRTDKPHKDQKIDASIFLDIGDIKRASWIFDFVKTKYIPILNIDHHASNTFYGDINYVDSKASSTSECVYNIFTKLGMKLTKNICDCIATGIITDTGRFSFRNTSEKTFLVCSELARLGVNFSSLSNCIYNQRTFESIQLLSSVLSTTKVREGIAFIRLTQKMITDTGATEEESEGFVNYVLGIKNIKASIFFKEKSDGVIRVSLRAKNEDINVNTIASHFDGGGHRQAAGFRSRRSMEELEEQLLNEFHKLKVSGSSLSKNPKY
ncbi:bifunctional oligoribonuclease/PAP phosphatase NrnA [candidate division WOR-3 bacterium]|nr:bifunctional oligoribonuclease/PAP phosphatase NrnA [candidate division WOR-3 bacterium]